MDRARYFEYVYRLPEDNRNQLKYKEDVYDKQMLLNEEWRGYATRCGKSPELVAEERAKWVTETWDEYEERKVFQKFFLEENAKASEVQQRVSEKRMALEREKSRLVIERLMQFQGQIDKTRMPSTHNLYVDFRAAQQNRFRAEREFVESHENILRIKLNEMEITLFLFMKDCAERSDAIHNLRFKEREAAEEKERQRMADEVKRAAEELIKQEEQRKREEEEAEKQRREQAETEKRLERKKREEMRRAKSRADRQRQNQPAQKYNDEEAKRLSESR